MKRLGTVLHLSPHGVLVVKLDDPALPRMNSKVVTKKMERIGSIYDIFGPESAPYVSIKLDKKVPASKIQALIKDRVYVA